MMKSWTTLYLLVLTESVCGAAATAYRQLASPSTPGSSNNNNNSKHNHQFFQLIAATDYSSMYGAEIVPVTAEGIHGIGSLDAGDSLAYALTLPSDHPNAADGDDDAYYYEVHLHVSSPDGQGSLLVGQMETQETFWTLSDFPVTGPDEWTTIVTPPLALPGGSFTLQIGVTEPGWSLLWLSINSVDNNGAEDMDHNHAEANHNGDNKKALQQPEKEGNYAPLAIELEKRESPAVADGNHGMKSEEEEAAMLLPSGDPTCFTLEVDAVDYVAVDGIFDQETADGQVSFVGFIDPGDSLSYQVSVPYSSHYQVRILVASPEGIGNFQVSLKDNNDERVEAEEETIVIGTWEKLPRTANWESFEPVQTNVMLPAGEYTLRFDFTTGGFNLQGFQLEVQPDPTGFDLDLLATDYSAMDGDVTFLPNGLIAFEEPGSHLAYDVILPADGTYYWDVRVASPTRQGGFQIVHLPSMTVLGTLLQMPITVRSGDAVTIETASLRLDGLPAGCHRLALWPTTMTTGWQLERVRLRHVVSLEPGVTAAVNAADYASMRGVFVQEYDDGRPSNLIFLDRGDYTIYDLTIPFDGTYWWDLWVAAPSGDGVLEVVNLNSLERWALLDSLPSTGSWDNWQPTRAELKDLAAGDYSIIVRVVEGGANWQRFQLTRKPDAPYGTAMQAATDYKYMVGGAVVTTETSVYLGFLDPTDRVTYHLTIPAYGLYEINLRVASPSGDGSVDLIRMDTMEILTTIDNMPNTGDWDTYDASSTNLVLPPGTHELMLEVVESGFNLGHIQIMSVDPTENGFELTVPASGASIMEGVSMDDSTTDVTFSNAGDLVAYEILIPADGMYYLDIRVSSPLSTGGFEVIVMETLEILMSVDMLPATDDFDQRETISIATEMTVGVHTIMLSALDGGWLLENIKLRYNDNRVMASLAMNIMVEDYVAMNGAAVLTDDKGMTSLGFLDAGDSVDYAVNIEESGLYKFEMWVASPGGEGTFELVLVNPDGNRATDDDSILATFDTMPRTDSWEIWEAVGVILDLPAGSHTWRINVLAGGANIQRFRATYQPALADLSILYGATDYYALGGVYVEEGDVDNLSFLDAGDFIAYSIMVPAYGVYKMNFRVAGFGDGAFSVTNKATGELLASFDSIPSTGDWQSYEIVSADFVGEPGVSYDVMIEISEGGFNFQSLELVAQTSAETFDFDLEAADYSIMQGVGVETTDPLVTGEALAPGMDSVTNVAFLDPGDFFAYEVIVPTAGLYHIDLLVSSPTGAGAFDLVVLPTETVLASMTVMPTTEDWLTPETLSFTAQLPAGYHTLAVSVVTPGFNVERIRFYRIDNVAEPGVIELDATEFSTMQGVEIIEEEDGQRTVAFLDKGDWMAYPVIVPFETPYKVEMLVSSPSGEGGFQLLDLRTFKVIATIDTMPVTGSWDNYEYTSAAMVTLPDGDYSLAVRVLEAGANFRAFKLTRQLSAEGLPIEIPGTRYHSMVGGVLQETLEGELAIAFLEPGDFIAYEIDVPATGTYRVDLRVASPSGEGALDVVDRESGEILASLESMPNTRGWENWDDTSVDITVEAGLHVLVLSILEAGFNYERLQIGISTNAEDFAIDLDASDFSEMEGVELKTNADGSITVSSLEAGDFVAYDVILPATDTYYVDLRVGSPEGAGAFELVQKSTGTALATMEHMPITNDEQGRETISMAVTLPEGYQTLQVHVLEEGWVLDSLSVRPPVPAAAAPDGLELSAADFTSNFGVQVQTPPETGIPHVAFLDAGDWMAYDWVIPYGGTYLLELWVASPSGEGMLEVFTLPALQMLGTKLDRMPVTGNWETWKSVSMLIEDLESGTHKIMLRVLQGGVNLQRIKITRVPVDEDKYEVQLLPSAYDSLGGVYLPEEEEASEETAGDVVFLSFLDPGDWVAYKLGVEAEGTYQLFVRVASPTGDGAFQVWDMTNGQLLATVEALPPSGSWDKFLAVRTPDLELSETQVLMIQVTEGGFNMADSLLTEV